MSHFTAAVISKTPADVDRLMLPFYEWDGSDDYPKHFLKFHNVAEEYQNQYTTGLAKMIRFRKTGKFVMPYATELYREISEAEYNRLNDENRNLHDGQQHYLRREKSGNDAPKYGVYDLDFFDVEEITVPWTELYPTIENFLEDYYGYEFNKEYCAYGYLRNPNRKWDYYRVGGRWRNLLKLKDGMETDVGSRGKLCWELSASEEAYQDEDGYCDSVQIKHICFDKNEQAYETACREWDIVVNNAEKTEEESKKFYYNAEYLLAKYGDKETYADSCSKLLTYALVYEDESGEIKWYAPGDMGWFGMGSENAETQKRFMKEFYEIIEKANPEHYLTILDCHI